MDCQSIEDRLERIRARAAVPDLSSPSPWSDLAVACDDRQFLLELVVTLKQELFIARESRRREIEED